MSYGFVYILGNKSMPGIYKLGMTSGSPHKRAKDLSASTGVATPFVVLCYAEFENALQKERECHEALAEYRVSDRREFFECQLEHMHGPLYWDYDWLSYSPGVFEEWRLEQIHNKPRTLELVKA
jgi:hypothetical protein